MIIALGAASIAIWIPLLIVTWDDLRSLRKPIVWSGRSVDQGGFSMSSWETGGSS